MNVRRWSRAVRFREGDVHRSRRRAWKGNARGNRITECKCARTGFRGGLQDVIQFLAEAVGMAKAAEGGGSFIETAAVVTNLV